MEWFTRYWKFFHDIMDMAHAKVKSKCTTVFFWGMFPKQQKLWKFVSTDHSVKHSNKNIFWTENCFVNKTATFQDDFIKNLKWFRSEMRKLWKENHGNILTGPDDRQESFIPKFDIKNLSEIWLLSSLFIKHWFLVQKNPQF